MVRSLSFVSFPFFFPDADVWQGVDIRIGLADKGRRSVERAYENQENDNNS